MARVLLLTVRFHDGRYHGTGDGPPSPARLFQALVAGVGLGGPLDREESKMHGWVHALEWLERQEPPLIAAPRFRDGQPVLTYVPNNDLDAVGGDPSRIGEIRAAKSVRPRLFDGAVPLLYAWFLGEDEDSTRNAALVCELSDRLYQLGRGVDMAWAFGEVLEADELEERLSGYPGLVLRPSRGGDGTQLAHPRKGSLASLLTRHEASSRRFQPEGQGTTSRQRFSQPPRPRFDAASYDSPPRRQVFEIQPGAVQDSPAAWPLDRASPLIVHLRDGAADRLRRALPDSCSSVEGALIGRQPDGTNEAPPRSRVRIVPLPSIGHHHADRAIRRVLIEVPADCCLRPEDVFWAFSGLDIVDMATGETSGLLVAAPRDEGMLRHYGISADADAMVWRTVTPAALPESAQRRRIDRAQVPAGAKGAVERDREQVVAAAAVAQALRHAGSRARAEVLRVQREPFEGKGERAEAFAPGTRFSPHRLWHVELAFEAPIGGPLVIGDGRFLGLGVMRPVRGTGE